MNDEGAPPGRPANHHHDDEARVARPSAGELRGRLAAAIDELDIGDAGTARAILDDLLVDLEPRTRAQPSPKSRVMSRRRPLPERDPQAAYPHLVEINARLGIRPPRPPEELREAA
jgi:hypothetical protein